MNEGGANESPKAATEETKPDPEPQPEPEPEPEPGPSTEPPPEPPPEPEKPKEEATAKMVTVVGSLVEFQSELDNAAEKLVVVDFSATWCGPCKMIKPFFHSLSEKYPDVTFIEIDVDDAQDVAAHCDVKCMPTFQFYKNKEKVHEFSGANKEKLEETIKKLK
ncbi:thioredoxin [Anolis carolinensis]|uniref:Thioredoxin n=1 Tax=Anolis carolinensis TaxID=28377 RepID=H9GJI5_ANOCA|nr:PREDICTED: thioredoxin [Anolis carolinensis]|eukprot:XP_003227375.1 PREDICTED: thioredoxin [Anolis carolinensis]